MAEINVVKAETKYHLVMNEAEVRGVFNGLTLLRSRYDNDEQLNLTTAINRKLGEIISETLKG